MSSFRGTGSVIRFMGMERSSGVGAALVRREKSESSKRVEV